MDLQNTNFKCNTEDTKVNYKNLDNTLRKVVGKYALINYKIMRNKPPFMNRELRKAIYKRSRFKHNFF